MSFIENFAENLAEDLGDALASTADAVGGFSRNAADIVGGAAADAATVAGDKAIAIGEVVTEVAGNAVGYSHTVGADAGRQFVPRADGLRAKPVEMDKAERLVERLDREVPSVQRAPTELASDDELSLKLPDLDLPTAKTASIDDLPVKVVTLDDQAADASGGVLGGERPAVALEDSKVELDRAIDEVALDLGEAAAVQPADDVFADVSVPDATEDFEVTIVDDAEPAQDFAQQLDVTDDVADATDALWDDVGE